MKGLLHVRRIFVCSLCCLLFGSGLGLTALHGSRRQSEFDVLIHSVNLQPEQAGVHRTQMPKWVWHLMGMAADSSTNKLRGMQTQTTLSVTHRLTSAALTSSVQCERRARKIDENAQILYYTSNNKIDQYYFQFNCFGRRSCRVCRHCIRIMGNLIVNGWIYREIMCHL